MVSNKQILVTGGTGKTGRRIVERLQTRGISVRVGSRSAETPFDWTDKSTWQPVLTDMSSVYIAYQPDVAVPGAVETIREFAELAVAQGVNHLVLLSGRGEEEAEHCEQMIQNIGVDWTILRASWFCQNFSESFLLESVLTDTIYLPVADIKEPFIDVEDIADVAVAALTEDGHSGQLYELTGSRMYTFTQAVDEIATATGRQIQFVQIPTEKYLEALKAEQLPPDLIWLIGYLFDTVLDGRNAYLTDGVQRALGRQPRSFSDYVRDTASTGIWNGQEHVVSNA